MRIQILGTFVLKSQWQSLYCHMLLLSFSFFVFVLNCLKNIYLNIEIFGTWHMQGLWEINGNQGQYTVTEHLIKCMQTEHSTLTCSCNLLHNICLCTCIWIRFSLKIKMRNYDNTQENYEEITFYNFRS